MSIVKCSDGKKDRQTGGGSDAVKNSSNDPQERTKKSQESKPVAPPVNQQQQVKSKMGTTGQPDDGYEACPDLNSKQLAKIAAET
ncbi:hypothetical protein RB195_011635 [Necator americanus]